MVATTRVVLLLLGLIVICTAADTIGPFNKAVLMGRGLAAQKRGFYNNGCNLEKCWDAFYNEAFRDISSCRTAREALNTCVSSGMTSEGLCTCNFHQVETGLTGLADIDDNMCASLHNLNYGRCADAKAQACAQKMDSLSEMMHSNTVVSVEDKKSLYSAVQKCLQEVVEDGLSTVGCEYKFPKGEDDMAFAINMLAVQGWAQGCEDISKIAALCPSPVAETVEHCSDEDDVVAKFEKCTRKKLTGAVCSDFLSDAVKVINKLNKAACTKIIKIQTIIDDTCGEQGRKRRLFKRLLNLLQARN